jgi:hypothetical protein
MATRIPGQVVVQGWALDPDTAGSIPIHVYVDGKFAAQQTANGQRGDVAWSYPRHGAAHGFNKYVPVGNGPHTVCVYAINQGNGNANPRLGCSFVQNTPWGNLEQATPTPWGTVVSGWAIGRDTTGPVDIHLYYNGQWLQGLTAADHRPDVGAAFPGYSSGHGFKVAVPNRTGVVCGYAIAKNGGQNAPIGCSMVNTNPVGNFDGAARGYNGVRVQGWALERDANGAVPIHIYARRHDPGQRLAQRPRRGAEHRSLEPRVRRGRPGAGWLALRVRVRDQPREWHDEPAARLPPRHLTERVPATRIRWHGNHAGENYDRRPVSRASAVEDRPRFTGIAARRGA